jgi:hypothetical protein
MGKALRIVKWVFLILTVLLCLAIPISGLVSTAANYRGICYGFTDSRSLCP